MRSLLYVSSVFLGLVGTILPQLPARAANTQTTLRIGLREDPDILDPTLSGSYVGRIVYAGMCDKLFDYDTKLDIVPQLATSYTYKDPTHLILHLRAGVLFQDGEKMDADSVKYTLNRGLTMPRSLRKGQINDIASMNVIDPLTLEIVLKQPNSAFLAQLAGRPGIVLAPQAAEKEGDKFGEHPVCAGPFRFVQRIPQQKIVLERFKRYWDAKAIHFDRLEYVPIVNSAVAVANLQAGALDLMEYVVPTDVPVVEKDPKLRIAMQTGLANFELIFNVGNGPEAKSPLGESADLRRAFDMSIDRTALIHVVFNGLYTPIGQANPPSSKFHAPTILPTKRNIAEAKKLVAASGFKGPFDVTLMVPNSPALLQAAQVIQAMVQPAGFNVKIRATEFASSLAAARSGHFQVYLIQWSGRADADGNMYSFLHTGYGFNYGHYSNAEVDKLLDQARLAQTVPERVAIYTKLWQIEHKDMPVSYLWSPKNIVGLKKSLLGFRQVPDGIIRVQGMHFAP